MNRSFSEFNRLHLSRPDNLGLSVTNSFVDQFRLYRLILETEVLLELNPTIRSGSGRSDQVRFAGQL